MDYRAAFRQHPDAGDALLAIVDACARELDDVIAAHLVTAIDPTICHGTCLRPSSTPHSHTRVTGFALVTRTSIVDYDLTGHPQRTTTIYPAPTTAAA